jgi:ABC-type glycerol-3-phosphate transport system permease component
MSQLKTATASRRWPARGLGRSAQRTTPAAQHRPITTLVILSLVGAGALLFMLPFLWMVATSLTPFERLFVTPPQWIPQPLRWQNYAEAFSTFPFLRYASNSAFVAIVATLGKLLSGSLVAYSFARLRWPGRDLCFLILLSTLMLPDMVTLVPQYLLFKQLGWLNSYLPLVVPYFFGGTPFTVFFLRQFFLTIPRELSEAATIDGASEFRIYAQIILPLSKPALAAIAVLSFVFEWNELVKPLIYLNDPDLYTIPIGLLSFRSEFGTYFHLLMAASLMALVPVLLLFFLAQRYFVEGLTLTGIKG